MQNDTTDFDNKYNWIKFPYCKIRTLGSGQKTET